MPTRTFNILILALSVAMLVSITGYGSAASEPRNTQEISMIQLIANPDKFDGKSISVTGFFAPNWEGDSLYHDDNAYSNSVVSDSIWLDRTEHAPEFKKEELELKYVKIMGTFHLGDRGRLRGRVGGISDIKMCVLVSDPSKPRLGRISR